MNLRPCIARPAMTIDEAKSLLRNFGNVEKLRESLSSINIGASGPIQKWDIEFLFDYDIFPATIMRFDAEWQRNNRRMRTGDVIVQRVSFPPLRYGLCLEFAVRITHFIETSEKLGFAYETLSGHVECGLSEFYFEEREHEVVFTIHTFSEPASRLSRLFSGLTLSYQWCTRQALKHVKNTFNDRNKERG